MSDQHLQAEAVERVMGHAEWLADQAPDSPYAHSNPGDPTLGDDLGRLLANLHKLATENETLLRMTRGDEGDLWPLETRIAVDLLEEQYDISLCSSGFAAKQDRLRESAKASTTSLLEEVERLKGESAQLIGDLEGMARHANALSDGRRYAEAERDALSVKLAGLEGALKLAARFIRNQGLIVPGTINKAIDSLSDLPPSPGVESVLAAADANQEGVDIDAEDKRAMSMEALQEASRSPVGGEPSHAAKIAAYEDAHATAVELGFPSITEALERLAAPAQGDVAGLVEERVSGLSSTTRAIHALWMAEGIISSSTWSDADKQATRARFRLAEDELLRLSALSSTRGVGIEEAAADDDRLALKLVAWRVHDFADGWFAVTDSHSAQRYKKAGHLVEPLYAARARGDGLLEKLDSAILGLNPLTGYGEDAVWRPADKARSALIEARDALAATHPPQQAASAAAINNPNQEGQ